MSRRWDGEQRRAFRDFGVRCAVNGVALANGIGIAGGNSLGSGVTLSLHDVQSVGTTLLLDVVGASRGMVRGGQGVRGANDVVADGRQLTSAVVA